MWTATFLKDSFVCFAGPGSSLLTQIADAATGFKIYSLFLVLFQDTLLVL